MFSLAFAWVSAAAFVASLLYFLYAYLVVFARVAEPGATAAGPIAANVALFTAFALHHSLFARAGLKRAVARAVPPPLERSVYTLVSSVLFAMVCALWQPVPGVWYAVDPPWTAVPYVSLAAGIAFTALGARALDVLELSGVRQVLRARTGAAAAAPVLETRGVYAFVRHPVYFGWILIVFGVATMTMTRLTFAVTSIAYLAIAVPFEERGLRETFGADYASYQQKVRWRMLPGLY